MTRFLVVRFLLVFLLPVVTTHVVDVTSSQFQQMVSRKRAVFLYLTTNDCDTCKLLYSKFLIAAQTFEQEAELLFGRVSDPTLHQALKVTNFPQIVFYESSNASPQHYDGDIAPDALVELVAEVTPGVEVPDVRRFSLELTDKTIDDFLGFDLVCRQVMLHEKSDDTMLEIYEQFAQVYVNDMEVLIMRINIDKYPHLRLKFHAQTYPAFYWYEKGDKEKKKKYGGVFHILPMIHFINERAGLYRTEDGSLSSEAGIISALDDIVTDHAAYIYNVIGLDTLYSNIKMATETLEDSSGLFEYYLYLVNELAEARTTDFLKEETSRLYSARMNDEKGPMTKDNLTKKLNIVGVFTNVVDTFLLTQLVPDGKGILNTDKGMNSKRESITPYLHDEM